MNVLLARPPASTRRPRFMKRRLIADALSATNLGCGLLGVVAALHGRPDVALLLLLVGALCDGLDGAAARRFGSTPWGVWSDDVADAVSYAIAPAFAVAVAVDGPTGVVVGGAYALFTLARLAYFTAAKSTADPGYFAGVPSTIGGVVALTSSILFADEPALVGLLVGVACAQMVAFDASYRHLGRVVLARRRNVVAALVVAVLLGVVALFQPVVPVAALLAGALAYAFVPAMQRVRALGRP